MDGAHTADWVALGFCLGLFFGGWFAVSALTHDEVVRLNNPCTGCAKKRIEKEVKYNG